MSTDGRLTKCQLYSRRLNSHDLKKPHRRSAAAQAYARLYAVNASPSRAAAEAHPLVALLNRYGNSQGDAQPVLVQLGDIGDAARDADSLWGCPVPLSEPSTRPHGRPVNEPPTLLHRWRLPPWAAKEQANNAKPRQERARSGRSASARSETVVSPNPALGPSRVPLI